MTHGNDCKCQIPTDVLHEASSKHNIREQRDIFYFILYYFLDLLCLVSLSTSRVEEPGRKFCGNICGHFFS